MDLGWTIQGGVSPAICRIASSSARTGGFHRARSVVLMLLLGLLVLGGGLAVSVAFQASRIASAQTGQQTGPLSQIVAGLAGGGNYSPGASIEAISRTSSAIAMRAMNMPLALAPVEAGPAINSLSLTRSFTLSGILEAHGARAPARAPPVNGNL